MPKQNPKRQPCKILVTYIDSTAEAIRRILIWSIDPNKLTFTPDAVFNSGDLIAEALSLKAVMEKAAFFIKTANEGSKAETLPDLIIWDKTQLGILQQYIPNLSSLVKPNLVILQERCYHIFKYQLGIQEFSLQVIADIMGFEGEDYSKMAKIALHTERTLKEAAKKLKTDVKQKKETTESVQGNTTE